MFCIVLHFGHGLNTQFVFVLDASFNSGHYAVIIKRQFLYINVCINEYLILLELNTEVTVTGRSKSNGKAETF